MKLQRTKNATRNIFWGIVYQIVNILLPFVARTLFIKILGEEYLGLNSLFGSILNIINISELGISSAIVYSMYGAIARDDDEAICALMNFYRICYCIIGCIVFAIGCVFIPFLPKLISGTVPEGANIYILYVINLLNIGVPYFLFAYKHSLFWAFQRDDLSQKVVIPLDIMRYIIQIIGLMITKNYYVYLIVLPIFSIITNVSRAKVIDKHYPQYVARGRIDKKTLYQIIYKVKALVVSKIGSTLVTSFDAIIISMYLGIAVLGKYNNYNYIMTSVIGFVQLLFTAVGAGIGNSLETEREEKNYRDFIELTYINDWILCFCSSCFLSLYQPFISLWIGDDFLLPMTSVALIVVYFYVQRMQSVLSAYRDAAGIWEKDQFRPIVVGVSNLILNVILVKTIGLPGVLLSSILTWIGIGIPWQVHISVDGLFHGKRWSYVLYLMKDAFLSVLIVVVVYALCCLIKGQNILTFILKGILCMIISNLLFCIATYRREECKGFLLRIKGMLRR